MISCIIMSCAAIYAQDMKGTSLPDLSGTWILVNRESDYGKEYKKYLLAISIDGNEVTIRKMYEFGGRENDYTNIIYADKRGELNYKPRTGPDAASKIKSRTFWRKDRLVRTFVYNSGIGQIDISVREEYRLSKDRSRLIFETRSHSDLPGQLGRAK